MNNLMSKEIMAKIKPKVVPINTRPLRSVEVITVRGGDSPGSRPVVFESMIKSYKRMSYKRIEEVEVRKIDASKLQEVQRIRVHL
jgi:hypothetical protein